MSYYGRVSEWLEEGAIFVDERVYPPRIFEVQDMGWAPQDDVGFDAVCVLSGEKLQGYAFRRNDDQPRHWRRINAMEILAYSSMTREEWTERLPLVKRGWNPPLKS